MTIESCKVLSICFSDLKRDPRVIRQLYFLNGLNVEIHVAGFSNPNILGVLFHKISGTKTIWDRIKNAIKLIFRQYESYYWSSASVQDALRNLSAINPDIIIANDLNTLPLARKLADSRNTKLFLDAHEYEPGQFTDRYVYSFFFSDYWDYIAKTYLRTVDAMTTVCESISQQYRDSYLVESKVITNAPFYQSLSPSQVQDEQIRLCHHGSLSRTRKLENMIFLMDLLDDRFSLDLMFIPNDLEYLEELKKIASTRPQIHFVPPVDMPSISTRINEYDLGIYLLSPKTFNCKFALPNKLFEYIQARLGVAIWPSPEMANVVRKYSCGIISEDFTIESMANCLNQLSKEDVVQFKKQADLAAKKLCAEQNQKVLVKEIMQLLS